MGRANKKAPEFQKYGFCRKEQNFQKNCQAGSIDRRWRLHLREVEDEVYQRSKQTENNPTLFSKDTRGRFKEFDGDQFAVFATRTEKFSQSLSGYPQIYCWIYRKFLLRDLQDSSFTN